MQRKARPHECASRTPLPAVVLRGRDGVPEPACCERDSRTNPNREARGLALRPLLPLRLLGGGRVGAASEAGQRGAATQCGAESLDRDALELPHQVGEELAHLGR